MIKRRIYPEDVTINLDKEAPIPEPNLKDHKWGKVIHDREVIWLATGKILLLVNLNIFLLLWKVHLNLKVMKRNLT